MKFSRRPSRSFVRPKRNGAWNGFLLENQALVAGTGSAWYLWDDLTSAQLNVGGRGVHQATHFHIGLRPGSPAAAGLMAYYLYWFTTDLGGNVPTASIFSPRGGAGMLQKSLMHYGIRTFQGNVGAAVTGSLVLNTVHELVKAKRRFDDTDALMLVIESSVACNVDVSARTYCTW